MRFIAGIRDIEIVSTVYRYAIGAVQFRAACQALSPLKPAVPLPAMVLIVGERVMACAAAMPQPP